MKKTISNGMTIHKNSHRRFTIHNSIDFLFSFDGKKYFNNSLKISYVLKLHNMGNKIMTLPNKQIVKYIPSLFKPNYIIHNQDIGLTFSKELLLTQDRPVYRYSSKFLCWLSIND